MFWKSMTGQVRFGKKTQPRKPSSLRKLMPDGFANRVKVESTNEQVEEGTETNRIGEDYPITPVSLNNPLPPNHG